MAKAFRTIIEFLLESSNSLGVTFRRSCRILNWKEVCHFTWRQKPIGKDLHSASLPVGGGEISGA